MAVRSERLKITPPQRECVEFLPEGPLLVRGIPGSGKTTVLLERARWLQENAGKTTEGPKVLVLTFNRSLANYMRQLSLKTGAEPVTVTTFHGWGLQLLRDSGMVNFTLSSDERWDLVSYARYIVLKNNPDKKLPKVGNGKQHRPLCDFLCEEISWLKGHGISDREAYMNAQRVGRGGEIQVTKKAREAIFDVYEKYGELLRSNRKIDFDDIALILEKNLKRILNNKLNPSHILIDEAQDLNPAQLRVIGKLAAVSLTIAADKGQRIYRRQFSWKSVGIDIHRSRSKFLLNTFRSTREIIQLARSLQNHDHLLKKDDEFLPAEDPAASGPVPQLYVSGNMDEEIRTVTAIVSKIRKSLPDDTIAVIVNSNARTEKFAEAFDNARIPRAYVKEDEADIFSPGVKLVTFYSAKGLEFDHVVVAGLRQGTLPYRDVSSGGDEDDFRSTELRKLYVAMTRARLSLTLSAVKPVSSFLDLLDMQLYSYEAID